MKTFTRREYNLVVKCLEYYPLMKEDEKKLSEIIQDKLYYFNVDKVTETNNNSEELSYVDSLLTTGISEDENLELPDLSNNLNDKPVIENGQYIPF
tara:strand:- start:407 stop:694 length:288 start_codon:yes stop_codon:yes gene_type:complete